MILNSSRHSSSLLDVTLGKRKCICQSINSSNSHGSTNNSNSSSSHSNGSNLRSKRAVVAITAEFIEASADTVTTAAKAVGVLETVTEAAGAVANIY